MPITLNHSNIGVQYSTGSNYIIETVKSDLYLRNEIVDTIVRDNIQTAPVTPIVSIQEGSNIYAVESYTYYGTANTADYTRVFPKNTVCDILVVGGGGGGGKRHGGGGGAGTLLYHKNIILNGTYNIKVGKGGAGHSPSITTTTSTALDGNFSQFVKSDGTQNYYAVGGGRGTGSLGPPNPAPHVYANTNGGQGYLYDANITLSPNNIFNGVPVAVSNKQYVNTLPLPEGCRGNIGGIQINDAKGGGGGGAGGAGMNHGEESTLDDGYGGLGLAIDITGKSVVYAGGGNGTAWNGSVAQVFDPAYPTIESRGGGGFGSDNGTPQNGLDGTGGGGGAQGSDTNGIPSGSGGSGIVIIRYLLGTIPTNNLLTAEPTVTPYVLITDGYYPRIPSTNSATWTDNGYTVNVKVSDPVLTTWFVYFLFNHIITSDDHYHSTQVYLNNGSTTYSGATSFKGNSGIAISIDIGRNIYPKRIRIAPRVSQLTSAPGTFKIYASNNSSSWNDNNHIDWVLIHSQTSAATFVNSQYTIISLSNTPSISYRYYTMVVMTLAGNYGYLAFSEWSIGGDEKFDGNPEGNSITYKTLNFTFNQGNIVAYYKFNNSSSLGIDSNPSSTKYNLTPTIVGGTGGYNTTIAVEGASFQATNDGDRLEGDLPLKTLFDSSATGISISLWFYKKSATYDNIYNTQVYRFIDPSNPLLVIMFYLSHHSNTYKSGFSIQYGVSGEIYAGGLGPVLAFDTWYHLVFIITKSGTIKVYINGTNLNLVAGSVDGTIRYYGSSVYPLPTASFPNTTKLKIFVPYGEGSFSGNVDEFYVFNKELSQDEITSLYNKTFSIPINQYTLNFPVPTIADINNNSNIVLRGAYDISLSSMNSSIIPKSNQYIPKPTTFSTSNLSVRYNLLNPVLDPSGAQWTYNTSNTNVYHMGNVGIGTKSPEYSLDVNGSLNANTYYFNGVQIGRLSEGMVANVQHLTYTHMEVKNNTGWDAINDDLTTGFVISITPKSNLSKILVNLIAHIGLTNTNDGRWWGLKLYRKIGTAAWTELTGPNGTETGSAATTAGTPVWISNNIGTTTASYPYQIINLTGTYLDSPNTTSIVYYTAYWNQRIGDNPSRTAELWLNRAANQDDAYRPAPSSSWTIKEIWYG